MDQIVKGLTRLKSLELQGSRYFTAAGFDFLWPTPSPSRLAPVSLPSFRLLVLQFTPLLRRLNLTSSTGIKNLSFLPSCRELTILNLFGTGVADLSPLVTHGTNLERLTLPSASMARNAHKLLDDALPNLRITGD